MTKKNDTDGTSRREFLKLAGAGAPVATVALAASSSVANAANDPDLSKTLIQDTEHTRAYLDSIRF